MDLLYCGIDSLDLRFGVNHPKAAPCPYARNLFDLFEQWKSEAVYRDPDLTLTIEPLGLPFKLIKNAHFPYRFVLDNPDVAQIYIWNPAHWGETAAINTGQFYISFRSVWLAQHGHTAAVDFAQQICSVFMLTGRASFWAKIARIDLCADVQREIPILPEELKKFSTRSRYKDWWFTRPAKTDHEGQCDNRPPAKPEIESQPSALAGSQWLNVVPDRVIQRRWDVIETLYFGRFKSPINARIYQKDREIKVSDKSWVEKLWQESGNYEAGKPVYRTEFSLDGSALRDFGHLAKAPDGAIPDFRDPYVVFPYLDQIWAYLTQSWLIQADRKANGKKEQVKFTAFWEVVRTAWSDEPPPKREFSFRGSCRELRDQMWGCFLSVAARMGLSKDLSAAIVEYEALGEYLKSEKFKVDYEARRKRYCLPEDEHDRDIDDWMADLSRKIRSTRIAQGIGS